MGYTTQFEGEFRLDKPLDDDTYFELEGLDGPFHESDGMPSLYCQWRVGDDWQSIMWDGGEKFYGYIGWIRLINDRYLRPRGHVLNGEVAFQGEEVKDCGRIVATNGRIQVFWTYDDPKLSNYDAKSHNRCHIPEGQGVCWVNHTRTIFVDVADLSAMVSETEDAAQSKMYGITIGNPKAVAILLDISAQTGTNREWALRHDNTNRVRVMSMDALLPLVDGERGAKARLEMIVNAAKRHCHYGDNGWYVRHAGTMNS